LKFRRDDRGGPRTLVRVPPTMVLPAGGRFNTDYYRVYRTDGSFFDVPPEDVIHWHGYNPDDALVGLSKLETLRDSLTEDATSQAAVVELMKAGLKGGHIERPLEAPDFSPEARERFLESWRAGGVSHLDRVLEEGMHWVPTAMTPKDAELLASRNRTVDEVAAVYGCPADLFRSAAGADGELEEARKQFYADTLPPLTEELGEQFDQDILVTEYGDSDRYFEFDLNEKLRGDPIQRFAAITTTTGRPWRTVNEARALEGMGPIDGGDELTIPLNVALGELPAPNVMPIQDPNKPPQDGSHREPPGGAAPPKSLAVKADPPVLHLVERHKSDLRRQKRYIGEALAVMERFYTRQARALRRKAQDFDMERWDRELADDLNGLLASIVEREGGLYVARLAGDDFDMRQVDHYIRETAVGVATAINEVTLADIEEQGLEDAMARARDERASVAATSLGARATIFARTEAAKQSPDYELRKMTWVPNTARHADFGGVTVGVEDGWPGGFAPGSAPNCACTASIA
jgi:HK97 family phage portal protein